MIGRRRVPGTPDETSDYMVTVGDLMAGLIFLFILTLMIFAFRFQTATEAIQSAQATRTLILQELERRLEEEQMLVAIDTLQGVLRLSDRDGAIGFEFGREVIVPDHLPRVSTLSRVLAQVVPCFSASEALTCDMEDLDHHRHASRIHALQIEGHTDTVSFADGAASRFRGNLELSAARAAHIHELMLDAEPALETLTNTDGVRLLGVSGYGSARRLELVPGDDPRQRRIDLRFIMEPPRGTQPAPVRAVDERLSPGPDG